MELLKSEKPRRTKSGEPSSTTGVKFARSKAKSARPTEEATQHTGPDNQQPAEAAATPATPATIDLSQSQRQPTAGWESHHPQDRERKSRVEAGEEPFRNPFDLYTGYHRAEPEDEGFYHNSVELPLNDPILSRDAVDEWLRRRME
jgi:hypothetical protein